MFVIKVAFENLLKMNKCFSFRIVLMVFRGNS